MIKQMIAAFIAVWCSFSYAATLSGTVKDENGAAVPAAIVGLANLAELKDTTDDAGMFTITVSGSDILKHTPDLTGNDLRISLHGKTLLFTNSVDCKNASVTLYSGNGRQVTALNMGQQRAGVLQQILPELSPGYYMVQLELDGVKTTYDMIADGQRYYLKGTRHGSLHKKITFAASANAVDTLKTSKSGYVTTNMAIDSYEKKDITVILKKENKTNIECADYEVPSSFNVSNAKMPDPFRFINGTRLSKKEEWLCRRNEIRALAEATIYGTKPPKPDKVAASFSNGKLTITSTVGSNSKSFSVTISGVPSGEGPHPAIINFGAGGMSMGPSIPSGVAKIEYPQDNVASERNPRPAKGVFNDLYPDLKNNQGALIGWAWGLSRIVDALELPEIQQATKIDPKRLGTMGCSRWGKGAGMAVFDDRIVLPIVLSPGSGFSSTWRVAETQGNVQKASQIYGECTWMGAVFQKFGGNNVSKLPIDQHEVIAMRAPRPIVLLEGTNDSWNCPTCCYHAAKYASFVFEALGVPDNFGWGHGNHGHCAQSGNAGQMKILNAFVDRFLLNKDVPTSGMFSESFAFDKSKWQDNEVPELEGEPLKTNTILWDE